MFDVLHSYCVSSSHNNECNALCSQLFSLFSQYCKADDPNANDLPEDQLQIVDQIFKYLLVLVTYYAYIRSLNQATKAGSYVCKIRTILGITSKHTRTEWACLYKEYLTVW